MIDIHLFYEMRVLQRDGTVFFDRVTINVSGAAPDPPARTRWEVVNYDNGRMRFLIAAPIAPLQAFLR